jgi:competence/damage-inducible protein CinA-like protein
MPPEAIGSVRGASWRRPHRSLSFTLRRLPLPTTVPGSRVNLEIITIGDELLLGFTIDTNAAWLARELGTLGVSVTHRTTVGDEARAIADAVGAALDRTSAVITTGGLGPTADDLTKPAIAGLFGRAMYFDEPQWERLRQMWRERGRAGDPPDANRQQVMIPAGARILENRHGSAPGIWLEDERGRWVAMLPGVPREMRGLWADAIQPALRERLGGREAVIRARTVRTTGVAESQLPTLLGDAARSVDGLPLAYLPGQEGVDLRLVARDLPRADADARLAVGAAVLRERVGKFVYGEDRIDLSEVVLDLCRRAGLHLAVAESCTGGLLGARLTDIPGSSDVLLGGVIAYSNDVKQQLLGVREDTLRAVGAVSEEVAREMAAGARTRFGADIGIGITGIAGPGGGTAEKPVGLVWIAVDVAGAVQVRGGRMIGDRAEIRFRATQLALDLVRRGVSPE